MINNQPTKIRFVCPQCNQIIVVDFTKGSIPKECPNCKYSGEFESFPITKTEVITK